MTGTSYALLAVVDQLGEASSYDIKVALGKATEAFWPIPHTTAYEEPLRLVRQGYLSARQQVGGRRRRSFKLTKSGKSVLLSWLGSLSAPDPELRDEGLLKVYAGADALPLLRSSADWHRGRLAELEGRIERAEAGGA